MGAADYLALPTASRRSASKGTLDDNRHNAARRLISFIDVWYDRGRELHMAGSVERLFEGLGSAAELEAELGPSPPRLPSTCAGRAAPAGLSSTYAGWYIEEYTGRPASPAGPQGRRTRPLRGGER